MTIPAFRICLAVTLVIVCAAAGHAQVASRISGTVRDSSQAAVPGVTVTVREANRGTTHTTITNEVGRYSFPNLTVGDYVVTAEMAGFKRAATGKTKLDVNQSLEVDITLELGDVTQEIEVTSAAPLLQTSDSQVGGLIENKEIVELPLAARDFMQLTLLAAGVVESTGNSRHQTERATWVGSFSVHGQHATFNQYLFDGIPGKEAAHQTNIFAPSIDAIQEIKIETSNYNAEFGSEAGGHVNVVTRSGTNTLHGTAFEFLRNDKLDAREKFADRRSKLNRNTFGATLGGPIRRDRTFFFGSWESMRLRQGFTQDTTVPTPAFREGDFSALLGTDFSSPQPILIYDWTTGQPFPGNIVPRNRMHPLTTRFLGEFVPLPNRAGRGGIRPLSNYQSLEPQKTETDQFILRLDHEFNPTNRFYARYVISDTETVGPPVWPAFSYSHLLRGQHIVLNWTRTLSPTRVFELRTGYSRFNQTELVESAFTRDVSEELGLKGTCRDPACWHAPYFRATDFSTMGNPDGVTRGQGVSGPRGWKDEIYQLHATMSLVHGRHTIKFGFTGNRYRDTFPEAIRPAGDHEFNGQWTRGAGSAGFALADMLLGLPRRIQASIDIFDPNFRNNQIMPWFQDDWKVTPRLTLNLGMRYEWMGRLVSKYDAISNFFQTGPATAVIITPQDTGKGHPFVKAPPELGRSLLENDNNNFAPRLGFAYQARPSTVVRGAFGLFYQRESSQPWIGLSLNPPFIRTGDVTLEANAQSIRDFPVDDLTPVINFVRPGSRPAVTGMNIDWKEAYVMQWNLYVERAFGKSLVLKTGYVGNHAVGLPRNNVSPNEPPPGPGDVQARRPFQDIGVVTLRSTSGQSTYHGLEVEVQKRYSAGLSFISGYTWAKTLDNRSILDLWFGGSSKSLSSLHVAQRFSYAGIWELPYGRGRRYGADAPALARGLLGGWQASGILVLRTGFPLTVGIPGNVANTGGISQVPNRIHEANLPDSERTENRFFDTGAFVLPAAFTLGNAGINPLIGPGFWNLDLSLGKVFTIREALNLQFRAEIFNALNHPNDGSPGTTLGTASFGRITSTFGDPRVMQFGLKLVF
jgi:Carboxypeptidase regulatory-like domain/TonB dependent receptor-like, beta-barrel